MDRQAQAQHLAEELLGDIELTRLPVDRLVMKAMRLARLTEDEVALGWLTFETTGCPNTEEGRLHMSRTYRWSNQEEKKGYWIPAAAIQASLDSQTQAMRALKIDSISSEYASIALREQ